MSDTDDRDLTRRFASLRKAISGVAPTFARTRTQMADRRSPTRTIGPRLRFAIATVATLAIAAVTIARLTNPNGAHDDSLFSAQVLAGSWVAPTDFLLDVPGVTYLRTVPSIGIPVDSIMPRAPASSSEARDSRNQS